MRMTELRIWGELTLMHGPNLRFVFGTFTRQNYEVCLCQRTDASDKWARSFLDLFDIMFENAQFEADDQRAKTNQRM